MMRLFIAGAFLLSMLGSAGALAQTPRVATVSLANHGTLTLKVPAAWDEHVEQLPGDVPPTITFSPKTQTPFEVVIAPAWAPAGTPVPDDQALLKEVQAASQKQSAQAVEKVIPIRKLAGPGASGYYFSVTDRAPSPGEFKYLTQGLYRIQDVILGFTVLTNDGQESVVAQTTSMIKSATLSRKGK
jgi:hypothetical protein